MGSNYRKSKRIEKREVVHKTDKRKFTAKTNGGKLTNRKRQEPQNIEDKKMTTIITTELKESLIQRIIANGSVMFNVANNQAQVLAECVRIQNFLIRNINYHGKFGKIECYTCYDSTDLQNLCIALQKIAETIQTDQNTEIFENIRGYDFGDFESERGIVQVYYKDEMIYAKTIRKMTAADRQQIIKFIDYMIWIVGNWKKDNRII